MRKIKVTLTMLDTWCYVEDTIEVAEDIQDYEIEELIGEWAADQIDVTYDVAGYAACGAELQDNY